MPSPPRRPFRRYLRAIWPVRPGSHVRDLLAEAAARRTGQPEPAAVAPADRCQRPFGRCRRPGRLYTSSASRRLRLLAARRNTGTVTRRPTFGDFANAARGLLRHDVGTRDTAAGHPPHTARAGTVGEFTRSMASLLAVMDRYCADITAVLASAPRRQETRLPGTWPHASIQAQEALHNASAFLPSDASQHHPARHRTPPTRPPAGWMPPPRHWPPDATCCTPTSPPGPTGHRWTVQNGHQSSPPNR